MTFAFGTTPCTEKGAIHVYADDFECHLSWDRPDTFPSATGPLGGLAAAAAAAVIALEHALPEIERSTGIARSRRPHPSPGPPVHIDLRELFPALEHSAVAKGRTRAALGAFDAVSGGAIVNALVATLLQLPNISGDVRVIESEPTDLSNVNRYLQLRGDEGERPKIDVLRDSSTQSLPSRHRATFHREDARAAAAPARAGVRRRR